MRMFFSKKLYLLCHMAPLALAKSDTLFMKNVDRIKLFETNTRKLLYETDPLFREVGNATIYTDLVWESGGYYFAEWPKVMMTVGEYFQNMMKGKCNASN